MMNPWITIWLHPRVTMRRILDENPKQLVLRLAVLGGIAMILNGGRNTGFGLAMIFVQFFVTITAGAILGIAYLYVMSFLLRWTGGWIKGKGTFLQIRSAVAWSNVPGIWLLLLWLPTVILTGAGGSMGLAVGMAAIILGVISFGGAVWSFVIRLKLLGEAQGFSAWRALLNYVLSALVIFVPVLILALFLGLVLKQGGVT
jgi:hypothetical protein